MSNAIHSMYDYTDKMLVSSQFIHKQNYHLQFAWLEVDSVPLALWEPNTFGRPIGYFGCPVSVHVLYTYTWNLMSMDFSKWHKFSVALTNIPVSLWCEAGVNFEPWHLTQKATILTTAWLLTVWSASMQVYTQNRETSECGPSTCQMWDTGNEPGPPV